MSQKIRKKNFQIAIVNGRVFRIGDKSDGEIRDLLFTNGRLTSISENCPLIENAKEKGIDTTADANLKDFE